MLRDALNALLKAIVPALTTSTSLFSGGVYDTWYAVLVVSYAVSSLFLIAIAYSYLTGRALGHFRGTAGSLTNLSITLVLMPFTLYISQLLLDVNDAMTSAIVPYSQIASYSSMVTEQLGGYSLFTLIILSVVVALLYLMLVVRVLMVFFLASLMPLLCLCYSLEWTRSFAEKMITLLLEMSFLPFFVAVALRIGISASYSTIHSLQVTPLIIAGTYLMPLMIPIMISPGGSKMLQFVGLPSVSAVVVGLMAASAGAAGHVTGMISPSFKSIPGLNRKSSSASKFTSGRMIRAAGAASKQTANGVVPHTGYRHLSSNFNAGISRKLSQPSPGSEKVPANHTEHHKIYAGKVKKYE